MVLQRYEKDPKGVFVIDVAADKIECLYNDFDKNSPFIRRDLDGDLVEYLVECAGELKKEPFKIRFTIKQSPDEVKKQRVIRSVSAYFTYRASLEKHAIMKMLHRSAMLFMLGLFILYASAYAGKVSEEGASILRHIFSEGLIIAAWVSIWEAFVVFLIDWLPMRGTLKLYHNIVSAEIIFRNADDVVVVPPPLAPEVTAKYINSI